MPEEPKLHVVPAPLWAEKLLDYGITPETVAYWGLTKRLGFGDAFAPRAFYARGTIYVRADHFNNDKLVIHEYGHAKNWPNHEHPRGVLSGLIHAAKCGFDTRAFTGLLRFRMPPKALQHEYRVWRMMLDA